MDNYSRGFIEGERIAKLSVLTLLGIGVVEILVGLLSKSVGLVADGVDSLGDAVISFIVWLGLRLSMKSPDKKFHYGYFRVETFSALVTAIAMVGVASYILYQAYQRFINPQELFYPHIALATIFGAGCISLYRAFQMRRISQKYNMVSLKAGAYNSIKDGSASFIIFASLIAAYLGFYQMDAIGAMVIAGFIIQIAYMAIKESSLVLVDACYCPDLINKIKRVVEGVYKVQVESIKLRKLGPYLAGEICIIVDGNLTLYKVGELKDAIERDLRREIEGIKGLTIIAKPYPTGK
ncbi:MAG: cation diffusion facilitator family transporter [Candidatus Bathyarchaeia archaeon]